MKNGFLSINHPPSTHPAWVAGQALVNSGNPAGVRTDTPAGWPWQGFGCKPFDLSCLGHHGPRALQAIPSRPERIVPWPPLPWNARKPLAWRASFFPTLRSWKEGSTAIKREREKELLRRLPLHCLPFFSTELFVAHPLSPPAPPFPPGAAAGSLPCLQSSLRSRLWSSAISNIFFLLLATSSLLISFNLVCGFLLLSAVDHHLCLKRTAAWGSRRD
jgi:hypothetical protein